MKRQNVRTLSLVVCTFTYLLVGAAIFDTLESDHEEKQGERLRLQKLVWKQKYNMSSTEFQEIEEFLFAMKSHTAEGQWKFAGAFYFATTVATTIGYGHSTPKTYMGRIFCMIYALPGIPLCIVMFQSIGERINAYLTFIIHQIKKCFGLTTDVSQTHLIIISGSMCMLVLTAGAAIFQHYEKWTYFESFYYCFVTLTTIGFGDFVALQRNNTLSKQPEYVAFSLIFILVGLTVVSSAMNLLVLRFLTMNTEDEKRDEIEAAVAAREAMRLDGDVITANGGLVNDRLNDVITDAGSDLTSVCSCTCYDYRECNDDTIEKSSAICKRRRKRKKIVKFFKGSNNPQIFQNFPNHRATHYTVKRSPSVISHLLPLYSRSINQENLHCSGACNNYHPIENYNEFNVNEDEQITAQYKQVIRRRASI